MKFNQNNFHKTIVLLFLFVGSQSLAQTYDLCIGHYFTEPEAIEQLAKCKATYSNKKEWKQERN